MCLSTVYRMHDGEKQLVCKNVAAVRQQEGALVFTDIMGVQTRVEAVLDRMDLMENFIFIKDAKAGRRIIHAKSPRIPDSFHCPVSGGLLCQSA